MHTSISRVFATRTFALLTLAAPAGCFDGRVPTGAIIGCDTTRDCPEGTRCVVSLSRCVPEENVDDALPA